MGSKSRWWVALPITLGLVLAACGGDDGGSSEDDAEAAPEPTVVAQDADATTAAEDNDAASDGGGGAAGVMTLGDEEIAIDRLLCYFEEQPRAGLGGVFTHTAQGRGTNADGEPVVLDLSRARGEDGTVEDDVIVDIGEPGSDDAVGLRGGGSEGVIAFTDDGASGSDIEVSDFVSDPVTLSFDVACG